MSTEIDRLLEAMLMLNANLGLDSTYIEKQEAKKKQNEMLNKIKEIDANFFNTINIDEFPHLKKLVENSDKTNNTNTNNS